MLECGQQRPCGHACKAGWHAGPCAACHVRVTELCHCGKTSLTHQCHQLTEVHTLLPACVTMNVALARHVSTNHSGRLLCLRQDVCTTRSGNS